jgi:uncharacterized LabA/DUF88 family protein
MRTAVVIDYQNLLTRGHSLFLPDLNVRDRKRYINPGDFAEALIKFRNHAKNQQNALELVEVQVFRGLPDANADPDGNRLNQSQKSQWERNQKFNIQVTHRNLSYAWNQFNGDSQKRIQNSSKDARFPGKTYHRREEKGIDVMCAISLLKQLRREDIDAVILASIDADLEPALEEGLETFPHKVIETTSWYHPNREGGKNRIGSKVGAWNTGLPLWIFRSVLE